VYESNTYVPYPVAFEEIKEDQSGKLQRVQVHVSNVIRELQAFLEANDGLRGVKIVLIIVNKDDLTLGDIRSTFVVESTVANDEVVTFTLGKPISVFQVRTPMRIISRDLFPSLPDAR
jgi:phage-related protein